MLHFLEQRHNCVGYVALGMRHDARTTPRVTAYLILACCRPVSQSTPANSNGQPLCGDAVIPDSDFSVQSNHALHMKKTSLPLICKTRYFVTMIKLRVVI
jgi:hypothetical protein